MDEQLFAKWVMQTQSFCDTRRHVVPRGIQNKIGLGAHLVGLKVTFLKALLANQIFHLPTSPYVNPQTCPDATLDCYFHPVTQCRRLNVTSIPLQFCDTNPLHLLDIQTRAGLQRPPSLQWIHRQLVRILFRPKEHITRLVERIMPFRPCISMHIRSTDKITEDRLLPARKLSSFVAPFKQWYRWQSNRTRHAILVGSEDRGVYNHLRTKLAPHVMVPMDDSLFVVRNFTTIRAFLRDLRKEYRNGVDRDEGAALVAQIMAMAKCKLLFASYGSNIAILVHDFMSSEANVHDVDGRLYCGCGASFCI